MEIIKEEMSKIKHIYDVYKSDGVWHCEKCPVIYINSEYTYAKTSRKSALTIITTHSIKDAFIDLSSLATGRWYVNHNWFLNADNFNKEEVNKQYIEKQRRDELHRRQRQLELAKTALESAQANFDRIKG